jgi:hypothetical protein
MKTYKVTRKNGQVVKVQADREGITPEGLLVFENLNPIDANARAVVMVFKEWEYYEVEQSQEEKEWRSLNKQAQEKVIQLAQAQEKVK